MKKITIAIDGFSSCGKSTMAKDLAREIGYIYIDSGAMYRAVTLYSIENGIFQGEQIDTESLRKEIANIPIWFPCACTCSHGGTTAGNGELQRYRYGRTGYRNYRIS